MRSHDLGREAERFAAEHLQSLGYTIIVQNYRTPLGEIDIVARDGDVLVFVEVKARGDEGVDPLEAVDRRKQQRIIRIARMYLASELGREDVLSRFDVLAVRRSSAGELKAELIKDAFQVS
ncbi:MAG: YraN family protein [Elusimicrobia bacterium]|nr:YraN family protein [Elusimicrobiota bacterium]